MSAEKRSGFTLIELLVVIAIIAILAAILFPIFTSAREAGKNAACVSQFKQVGNALAMYRDDYDSVNPGVWANWANNAGSAERSSFWFVLTDYMKNRLGQDTRNIVKCPSAPWLKQTWTAGGAPTRYTVGFAFHINETGWADPTVPQRLADQNCLAWAMRDSVIKRPHHLIHVVECMGWPGYGVGYQNGANWDNERAPVTGNTGIGWESRYPRPDEFIPFNGEKVGPHGGAANALIYDGHVKSMKHSTGRNWGNYY